MDEDIVIGGESNSTSQVQILNETVHISQSADILWKGRNPNILSLTMGK